MGGSIQPGVRAQGDRGFEDLVPWAFLFVFTSHSKVQRSRTERKMWAALISSSYPHANTFPSL